MYMYIHIDIYVYIDIYIDIDSLFIAHLIETKLIARDGLDRPILFHSKNRLIELPNCVVTKKKIF